MQQYSIAIHGGAGTILKSEMTDELEIAYRSGLQTALDAGYAVLSKGGTATAAVLEATIVLENNILFNAGKGSVFTNKGVHEMDAAIMNGADLSAGAVAGVTGVKNPVELAYKVMMNSNHVLLCGEGANEFAREQKVPMENEDYFFSAFRYKQWETIRESDDYALDHSSAKENGEKKFGTVGAVACDKLGNIAAATSTGGMTNKKYGRVGDSPLIGCGTYANNKTCAISATGHGELFIKAVAAYDVSCLMEYKGLALQDAMHIVVNDKLIKIKGEGGMIGVDAAGNVVMLFNCEGMYRGMINSTGTNEVAIYR